MKNRDFDGIFDKVQVLRSHTIENASQLSEETESLIDGYSKLAETAKNQSEKADVILSKHIAYLTACNSFRAWCDELQQSLLLVCDFSGDRYTLAARFDRITVS